MENNLIKWRNVKLLRTGQFLENEVAQGAKPSPSNEFWKFLLLPVVRLCQDYGCVAGSEQFWIWERISPLLAESGRWRSLCQQT